MSWKLIATNAGKSGQRQTAYEVVVSSSPNGLLAGESIRWSTGRVDSDASVGIPYGGAPLQHADACYWRVRVWDEQGVVSRWSAPAKWSVGPMSASDWRADWIGSAESCEVSMQISQEDCELWDPWLRKAIRLDGEPRRAEMHVASIGYHELYVNGRRVSEDVLAPAVSNHRVRARYVTYDIASYLRRGDNVVALWLGASWSIYPSYVVEGRPCTPMVSAQAQVELDSGRVTEVVTDSTWVTRPSPNKLLGSWEFRNFGGELYDANRERPGWNLGTDGADGWSPATVYKPVVELSAEAIEPNRRVQRIEAQSVEEVEPGVYRVDMGTNFAGLLEVDVVAEPDARVELLSSERHGEAMSHRLRSVYVVGPSGKGTFTNRFNYHSGRWITIKGAARRPFPSEVRGFMVRTAFDRAGRFACSNELLNRVYETTLWTFENLSLGGYVVDCPQRERMGYGGDAHATIHTALANYSLGPFYRKWCEDWRDVQHPDGYLPFTAPTYWGGGGVGWGAACVTLPWENYVRYGDRRVLEENYSMVRRWLEYVESTADGDMIAAPWTSHGPNAGDQWSFLGDWLWPQAQGPNSHTRESLFFGNSFWVYSLDTAAKIADALGDHGQADTYRARANAVRKKLHEVFFAPATNDYVGGDQAYLALALIADLAPEDKRAAVWRRLEEEITERRGGHIHAGITGGAMLFKILADNNRDDLIYLMATQDDYPSWGDMLRQGATTIWESWDERANSGHSKLHSSYLYVGGWPLDGLVGLRPASETVGFQRFVVAPSAVLFDELAWAEALYDSDYGPIEVGVRRVDGGHELRLAVPPNAAAELHLPEDLAADGVPSPIPPGRWRFQVNEP